MFPAFRYSRWDGSQKVFDVDSEDLMDALSNDLMAHGDIWRALRDVFQRGLRTRSGEQFQGLRQLIERLRQQRQAQLQRYNMDSVVDDLKQKLDEIVRTERQGIQRRLDQARQQMEGSEGPERRQQEQLYKLLERRARRNTEKLDQLPSSLGGQVRQLMEYDFIDPEAQRQFQELLDRLKGRMLDNLFQNLRQQLSSLTPQDMQGIKDFLGQLNQMLRDQAAGRQPNFQQFMQQYGHLFGPNPPQNLDELMKHLAHQMAQMQSLLESMSPEQRRELEELLDSLMDPELQRQMGELASLMEQLMPMDELRRQYPFIGDESATLEQAMEVMRQLQQMDDLERQLQEAMRTGNLGDLDPRQLEELLGEEGRRIWDELNRLRELLEQAGYIREKDGKWELTPKAIRRIAHKALREVFQHLRKDRLGGHITYVRGAGGDNLGETKAYEFGDPFELDLQRTVMNAVVRQGPRVPVQVTPQDLEVYRHEHMTKAATVLLLDQSRSMGLFGSFQAAKKVALALFALIHSQFPRDSLYVIGFSDYAREIKEEDLPRVSWNAWVSGTNMQHALMLSRKLLARDRATTRQVILITDGEPTAHLEGSRCFFSYPPSYRTIQETLKEVRRCTQEGIVINTFMLETSYHLMDFVDKLTRINRGRAFYTTPDRLGEYVLVDYLHNRRKRVS